MTVPEDLIVSQIGQLVEHSDNTLIGLTFAGINFRGLLQPRNSKDFAGIYFRGWDFFKNFAIFADQILVMFFFQNGKMKG